MGWTAAVMMTLGASLAAAPARSEPAPPGVTEVVTVSELVARLRQTPEVAAALARVDAARADVRARAPWAANPELEAELALAPGEPDHSHAAIAIAQRLPLFAERGAGREAMRAALAAARAEADETLRAQVTAAARALAELGRGRAVAALETDAAEIAGALADAAERRARGGEIPEDDATLARIDATLAASRLDEARSAVARLEREACRVLGLDPCAAPPALATTTTPVPSEDVIVSGLERRADRIASDRRVAAARAELVHARGQARVEPIVGLGIEREVDSHAGVVWRVVGTIGLELPLWDPRAGQVDRQAAMLTEAEAQRDAARRDALARARDAHAELRAAVAARARLDEVADSATRIVDHARVAWERGAVELERVLLVRDRALAARRALVDAHWRVVTARALVELEMPP